MGKEQHTKLVQETREANRLPEENDLLDVEECDIDLNEF